jgi:cytidylate kinase
MNPAGNATPIPRFAFRPGERLGLAALVAAHAPALARLVVAIDGPAGSGKSTTARGVAACLGLRYLDTGAMYRAVTWLALRQGADLNDGEALARLAAKHTLDITTTGDRPRVQVDGADVSEAIRTPDVTREVSRVSAHAAVRRQMVRRQREIGATDGVVVDGRDIGTVVFPDADVKVFLVADVHTRAERRAREDAARGNPRPVAEIEADIARRDGLDTTREVAPLVAAPDAVELDTTTMSIPDQVDAVVALAVRTVRGEREDSGGAPAEPLARATLVPVDPLDWAQDGYRPFHSHLYRFAHTVVRGLARFGLGLRPLVHPAARLPGSALVACNHVSGFDPVLGGVCVPFETFFVAKLELFQSPLLARLIERFNAIPIRRGTADFEALDRAVACLKSRRNVLMFPEGTRQRTGHMGRAKWGFGYVAVHAGRPLVPVYVRGTRQPRLRPFRREPLEVWVGEPVAVHLGAGRIDHAVYKEVGHLVMERIRGLMLRSAAGEPIPGLDLPASLAAGAAVERTEASGSARDPAGNPL